MKRIIISIFIFIAFIFGIQIRAYDLSKNDKVYVGGEAIGIKLHNGIEVVGTFGVTNNNKIYKPWDKTGLREGDYIVSLYNKEVWTKEDLLQVLTVVSDKEIPIQYRRGTNVIASTITPAKTNNGYSLGLYIKDSIQGVGTLTYYIKDANIFGSLGHKITDSSFIDGEIYKAEITGIVMPTRNQAGEKQARIVGKPIGSISKNTNSGVHGVTNSRFDNDSLLEIPFNTRDNVHLGKATIKTCIDGVNVEDFDVEIIGLEHQDEKAVKGITLRVTDEELLKKTGGIVQGMSGSPIIQDGALIGAVTHVSLKDSTLGYGIYIEWMFQDMGITIVE